MSERILKALMQLFAIIAGPRSSNRNGRNIVESFLKQQLNEEIVEEYLKLFDGFYALYQKKQSQENRREKSLSLSSVKVLKICTQINQELDLRQKVVVLIRLLEFVKSDVEISEQELEFILTVADIFHYPENEFTLIKDFVLNPFDSMPETPNMLLIDGQKTTTIPGIRHLYQESFHDKIWVVHFKPSDMYLARCFGEHEVYINGQMIINDRVYILTQGSALRDSKMKPIYYSDIISAFYINENDNKIEFAAQQVEYHFKGGIKGLNKIDFVEESGSLIGIMGASGAGKSTLLNVLNGSNQPSSGKVTINGVDIHKEKEKVEGLIGFVSQDDLLIEELSVYQNLFYNAKLCFGNTSNFQLNLKVFRILKSLGLYEIKDMVVGNPLNKKISGGQRKRLNIALELIREPAILFLDEPTSGLSSRDSENIMDLLKELALKGKLIFTVIHQPSSDIFKMFDKLFILDNGGYLIYDGNPVDSIIYFKSKIHHANWNDSECRLCGNVNPEQVFNIIDSKIIDEYGNLTHNRRKTPQEWFRHLTENRDLPALSLRKGQHLPENAFKIPGKIKQFFVFITRDVLSKIANRQYLIINLTEAPILAFLLSFIIKYYTNDSSGYSLSGNPNLPVYLFISVIVAIFIGLSVSAEEIIKDRKILKRERFLNLSRTSYLLSKIVILIVLSAFQALIFVFIGNSIMGIQGMYFNYWLVLFSAWFFACMMGLNISDTFDTVVTIYILIPFLVIPQLILSGVIISFDKLNPAISSPSKIPWYGEIITARWAYEALAVYQFNHNDYETIFYDYNKVMSDADYKKNYWVKTLMNKVSYCQRNYTNPVMQLKVKEALTVLRNEIEKELNQNNRVPFILLSQLYYDKINETVLRETENYLDQLNNYYLKRFNRANNLRDELINSFQETKEEKEAFLKLKRENTNENLTTFVRNSNSLERIIEWNGQLVRKIDPIYLNPENDFIKAHFYAPNKKLFGYYVDTYWINILVMWVYNLLLYLSLHFRLLRRLIEYFTYKKLI
ncbi:MAG: ABC transporter [Bacteroidetes bacterium HGW-Bacteroidetes-4]|jgi:ABC-type multidrug transport system ATPase subunit|nr:MAG: ABC transporter [Bacteroidetes bacterium HGW-Bacteroidetes-4]